MLAGRRSLSDRPYESFVICTTPRSGSTLLCKLLAATGQSGNPNSHFHVPSLDGWLKAYGLNRTEFPTERDAVAAVFMLAQEKGRGDTGLFGLRLQRPSFDFFIRQVDMLYPGLSNDRARFRAVFGRTLFVYLSREDKLEQAISHVIATQSGLWHRAADGTELERLSPPKDPVYDAVQIANDMADLQAQDTAWRDWFEKEGLQPLRLTYRALADDPARELGRVLTQLGLDGEIAHCITPPVAKLANATNESWAKRFRSEMR